MTAVEERRIEVDGSCVGYLVAGSGPVLLLVHGTAGTAESNWAHLIPGLAEGHRVLAPDLPGSGASELGTEPLELAGLVALVRAVVAAEGESDVRVAGFSLGAVVAAAFAAEHPDLVSSAVLIGGWLGPDSRVRVQFELWQHLIRTDPRAAASFLTLTGFAPGVLSAMDEQTLRDSIELTAAGFPEGAIALAELDTRVDVRDLAPRISVPTTVVGMSEDHMVPVDGPRELAAAIPGAHYLELPGGHLAIYEHTAELADILRAAGPAPDGSSQHTATRRSI